ncbi:MAG: hypothetical protein JNM66_08295 [Bryobacterales bacterium]|nr:hypothetical protein [Bryobacterales bacterium]
MAGAEIVFVHGIAQEQLTADTLETRWRDQLSGGLRIAGHSQLADRMRDQFRPDALKCRMAFYGHLFLEPGAQGASDAEGDTANQLAAAWLANVAARSRYAEEADDARRAIAGNAPDGRAAQGFGATAGWAIRNLGRVPWFVRPAVGAASFLKPALVQVTTYLEDRKIRTDARELVLQTLTPDTQVVIAHSLGSVVAWEALHQRTDRPELPLLITIGSPLGLPGLVYPSLWPQPPTFPPKVARWINIADKDDFVAAEPDLAPLFPGGQLSGTWTPDNGASPHEAAFYLAKQMLANAVAEVLNFRPPREP